MTARVIVVIGVGGMGEAIARRQGPGHTLVLADFDTATLDAVAARLRGDGYDVVTRQVDVGSQVSVAALAEHAAATGVITEIVHTAGLSPAQADIRAVLRVDLFGVAVVLETFGAVVATGGAGVVIASMAGHLIPPLPADQEQALATAPADDLLSLPLLQHLPDAGAAYALAKRANIVRVRAESVRWGRGGARLNSISPGVIATPMGREELDGDRGEGMRAMVAASGTARLGTPADIAAAASFLLGPDSSFVTGTDLLVDGGVVGALTSGVHE